MKRISRIFCILISLMLIVNLAGFESLAGDVNQSQGEDLSISETEGDEKDTEKQEGTGDTEEKPEKNPSDNGQEGAKGDDSESGTTDQPESGDSDNSVSTADDTEKDYVTDSEKQVQVLQIEEENMYVSELKVTEEGTDSVKLTWNIEDKDDLIKGFHVGLYLDEKLTEQEGVLKPEMPVEKESADQAQAEAVIKGIKTGVKYYAAVTAYGVQANDEPTEQVITEAQEDILAVNEELKEAKPLVVAYTKLAAPKLTVKTSEARSALSWTKVSGATGYEVYQVSGSRRSLLTKTTAVAYTHNVPRNNVTYQYVVKAVSGTDYSPESNLVSSRPRTTKPGKVSNFTGVDGEKKAILTWSKVSGATSYYVYRYNYSKKKWVMIKEVKSNSYYDRNLKTKTKYKYRITAVRTVAGETVRGDMTSSVFINVKKTPGTKVYPMKYRATIRSKAPCFKSKSSKKRVKYLKKGTRVTTLNSGNGRYYVKLSNGKTYWVAKGRLKITSSIWTTRDYSDNTKLNFVNSRGYSSPTKYLIWISQYTQRVIIYEGKKGKWKINRSVPCATGTYLHKTPKGRFKITYKEKGWFYRSTYEKPIVHFKSQNSFHSRIKYYKGGYADATIGRPKSKGCVRLYDRDINFIYKKCPRGTTVVSY